MLDFARAASWRLYQPVKVPAAPNPFSPGMDFLSELRSPKKWYAKLVAAFLSIAFFAFLASATISGYLLYRIVSPPLTRSDINPQTFPGRPEVVSFTVPGSDTREGWFFPGLTTAPTIILCHGYTSQRGELLTLVSTLQDHQYNVFLFDFAAHGSSRGYSTLGYRETAELRAAIDAIAARTDVDTTRFGLWGTNLGAYAALTEAASDPRVHAVVVDSVYDSPPHMLRLLIDRTGLGDLPLMQRTGRWGFRALTRAYRNQLPLSARLAPLAGVQKLFLMASDDPILGESTRALFLASPEPRELALIPRGNYANMLDKEKRPYENRIVSFFLHSLPTSPSAPVPTTPSRRR